MKRATAIVLVLLLLLSLSACGGGQGETEPAGTESTHSQTEALKTEPTAAEPEPTQAPTELRTDPPVRSDAPYPETEAAPDEAAQKEAAAAVAMDFFDDYLTTAYLYENTDIESHTTLALDDAVRAQIAIPADAFPLQRGNSSENDVPAGALPVSIYDRVSHGETVLTDHAVYQMKKLAYWKEIREAQNIVREDLKRTAEVTDTVLCGDYAQVKVSGGVSFRYAGESEEAYSAEGLELFLYRYDGVWYVFDAFDLTEDTDNFDDTYRNTDFDVAALLKAK